MMFFNYHKYCKVNLETPLLAILLGSGWLLGLTVPQIAAFIGDPVGNQKLMESIGASGFFGLVCIFGFGRPFWAGGYHLLREKPEDMVCISGKLVSVKECAWLKGYRYHTERGHSDGYELTVNGETWLAMDNGRCIAGDDVALTVLPKSRIVLSIMKAEEK